MVRRLDDLQNDPYNPRISGVLTGMGGLRKCRIGDWRLIYKIEDDSDLVYVLMIERRGQVYQRI